MCEKKFKSCRCGKRADEVLVACEKARKTRNCNSIRDVPLAWTCSYCKTEDNLKRQLEIKKKYNLFK